MSENIFFDCEYCGETLSVPDHFAGKAGVCNRCRKKVQVPIPKAKDALEMEEEEIGVDQYAKQARVESLLKQEEISTTIRPRAQLHSPWRAIGWVMLLLVLLGLLGYVLWSNYGGKAILSTMGLQEIAGQEAASIPNSPAVEKMIQEDAAQGTCYTMSCGICRGIYWVKLKLAENVSSSDARTLLYSAMRAQMEKLPAQGTLVGCALNSKGIIQLNGQVSMLSCNLENKVFREIIE